MKHFVCVLAAAKFGKRNSADDEIWICKEVNNVSNALLLLLFMSSASHQETNHFASSIVDKLFRPKSLSTPICRFLSQNILSECLIYALMFVLLHHFVILYVCFLFSDRRAGALWNI